jgi:hypothetical protein
MKQIFTSLFLIAGSLQSLAQVTWSTPVTVSTGGTLGNLHPRVTLNRSGNPMVLWGKTDTKAYFSRWNGTAFTTPMAVGNSGINVMAQSWAGPDIASYGDTVYVTMKRTPETMNMNHMYMTHSYDGGVTFSDTVRIDNIDTSMSRFPIVTTTSTGNPLVAFMKFNTTFGDAKYVVSRSTTYGTSFSADALASGTAGDVCDCCPASIISSGSKAIMLFRNNLSNIRDIWAGMSSDGGATFPMNIPVDTTNWMIMSCPSSGPDGFVIGDSIYTVFMSTSTGTALVHLSRASISGMTAKHSPITGMFSGLSSQNYPRIANAGNAAAAVWKQNTSSGNSIVYSFTNNISSGLPTYTVVPTATGSGMMNADVAMTPGAIHIVWEDDNSGKVMYVKGTYTVPSTAIENVISKERIEVYPNPANDEFTVSLGKINNISSCSLTDNVGRNIDLKPVVANGKATFSLAGVAKGGYYFVMQDEAGKSYYSKIIVQ